jgi:uncharacterized membrane protein YedE/YeeE
MRTAVAAFGSGLVFAAGLCVSGMTRPSRVLGFLDVTGRWDPTLLFVMVSALSVAFAAQAFARRLAQPAFATAFPPAAPRALDARLIGGSALFGIGWGLGGFCPGPAIVAAGAARGAALVFVPGMLLGMLLAKALDARNTISM